MFFTNDLTPHTREVRGEHGQLEPVTLSKSEWGVLDFLISEHLIEDFDELTTELDRIRGSHTLQERLEDVISIKLHHLVETGYPPFDQLDDKIKQEYLNILTKSESEKYSSNVQ